MDSATDVPDLAGVRGGTLTVLGCDGGHPGPGGAASGYLVEIEGLAIWLDAGPGTFANLQLVADPGRLDAVILSHEHPDHCSDVDSYVVWLREHPPALPVPVYAPPGVRARSYFGGNPELAWHEVEPSQRIALVPRDRAAGGVLCTFSATDHGPPTLAVRMDPQDRSGTVPPTALAYSADTGSGWSPEQLGPGIG
ncbi:MAG: MBL fold metallo-hydrolase, partial [Acidimicrobiales bacterium]